MKSYTMEENLMNFKKYTALACSLVIAVGCLTSCKNDNKKNDSKDDWANATYYNGKHVDQGYEWSNAEIVGGGFVPSVIYNPSEEGLMYARTDIGGAYKMNKETGRWECITDFVGTEDWNYMGIESIATDPIEPNRVYLAAGTYTSQGNGAIFYSQDYGENWVKVDIEAACGGNEVGRGTGERLMIDPNDNSIIYFGTRQDGLLKSTDYGKTWNKVESFPTTGGYSEDGFSIGLTWVEFDKSSSKKGEACKTIFVGAAKGDEIIYRSDDSGKTWTALPIPVVEGINPVLTMKPIQGKVSEDGYLYATFSNKVGPNGAGYGSVQKYNIKSGEWTEITPPVDYSCGYSGLSLDASDNQTIVVTTLCLWSKVDNVLVTHDGGLTWDGFWNPETEEDQYELDISDAKWLDWQGQLKLGWWMTGVAVNPFNPDEVTYGTGATIFSTTNFTKLGTGEKVNIKIKCKGLEETAVFDFVSPLDSDGAPDLYSIMADLYGFKHQDATIAPEEHFGDFASTSLDCGMINYKAVVRTTKDTNFGNGVWYSLDAGDTWADVETLPEGIDKASGGQAVLSTDGKTILWQSGVLDTYAFRTEDYGKTWEEVQGLPKDSKLESDAQNPDIFYGVSGGEFYISRDGGKNFELITRFMISSFQFTVNPFVEGQLYVSAGAAGLFVLDTATSTELVNITSGSADVQSFGLGKSETEGGAPTIFIMGEANEEGYGVYRSTDNGKSWSRINDDTQKWGNVNPRISGDPKVFGRCYISTNGRGIVMGNSY